MTEKIIKQNNNIRGLPLRLWQHFRTDSLFRNSIYLMLSTGVMSGFGFLFWMIIARLYTTEQIGLATTMISVLSLITSLGLLGLDIGVIRYLPRSSAKNEQINTVFSATALATLIIIAVFLIGLDVFSPKLLFIRANPYYVLLFMVFAVFSTASTLIDNIFIAFRNTGFVLIKNTIFSLLKFVLPFFVISLGAYGVFSSYMAALAVSFIFAFICLIIKFNYKFRLLIHKSALLEIGRYSFGNYIAGFIGSLPSMILPLMITNLLQPEITAYYYMAMMIVGLLFIVPGATTQSLFAEGSHDENEMKNHVKKAARIIALILIPAILITVLFGRYILLVFGKEYSVEGFRFLRMLALSGIFVSLNSIFGTILKIKRQIAKMIMINSIGAGSILGLSYLFSPYGLSGIGWAWLAGQSLVSLVYLSDRWHTARV